MAGSIGLPVIDTMIGFPHQGSGQYDFIEKQTKDADSRQNMEFPVEYMFKQVPKDLPTDDPVGVTLHGMDRFGIEKGLIVVSDQTSRSALKHHPDRFVPAGAVADPNDVGGSVRAIRREHEEFGIRATSVFPAGTFPQEPIDDP
ncbi:MAG: amidohydrolase, partial [Mycobacteriaceae bacterium]|nr:amidohydrolase [Mycobacteriaceae bacterium]